MTETSQILTKTGIALADAAHFTKDGLVITDEGTLARIRRPYISVSTAAAITRCPSAMAGDRMLSGGFDLMRAAEVGTAAHTVMERLMQLPKIRRDETHAAKLLVGLAREEPPSEFDVDYAKHLGTDPVVYAQWIAAVTRAYSGLFAIEDPREVDVIATEVKFENITLDGTPVLGFIDRVDYVEHRGEKVIRIVDYKTGKPHLGKPRPGYGDSPGDQIKAYVEAYEELSGDRPKRGSLYYTAPGGGARVVAVSKSETRKVVRYLGEAWAKYQTSMDAATFGTGVTPLCGWCPLVAACPAAHRAGKVDRTDGAPTLIELGMPDPSDAVQPDPSEDQGSGGGSGDEDDRIPPMPPADTSPGAVADAEQPENLAPDTGRDQQNPPTLEVEETTTEEGVTMTANKILREGKPYDGATIDGHANFNSYAASLVSGVVGLAVEQLHNAGQRKTPDSIAALSDTFGTIIQSAMRKVGGRDDLDLGLATRMHGNLRAMVAIDPMQFNWTTEEWTDWVNRVVRRMVAMATVTAERIVDGFNSDYPWKTLAVDPQPAIEDDIADAWDEPVHAQR